MNLEVLNVSPYEVLQDTTRLKDKSEADYRVVSIGTSDYDFLLEVDSLDLKQKERLKGYISALKDK